MRIRDIPKTERPQEKMLFQGVQSLSTSELLALIIRTGTSEKSAVQLAEDVLAYSSSEIGSLGRAEVEELIGVDGIGVSKACSIIASMELGRRISAQDTLVELSDARSAGQIANLLMDEFQNEKKEHLVALLMNTKCEIESRITVSIGDLNTAPIHPREVFRPAIRKGAAAIVLVHNHPSGDPTPSSQDIDATKRLMEVADVVGIKLLDHLIIGRNRYVSLRSQGYMD